MPVASLPRPIGRQREVLYLPGRGHIVVLGTAGSGKTTLAILRSLHLADPSTPHRGRTLLVTFNRCLVTYMKHLAGAVPWSVDVCNYHRFARGYLISRHKMPWGSISAPDERLRFIEAAVISARNAGVRSATLDRGREFFDEEFRWIQQHGIVDAADYVAVERIGRSNSCCEIRTTRRVRVIRALPSSASEGGQAVQTGTTWPVPCAKNSATMGKTAVTATSSSTRDRIFRRKCCDHWLLLWLQAAVSLSVATSRSRFMGTGCLGGAPDCRLEGKSGDSRTTIGTRSRSHAWRWRWQQCRTSRMIPI